MEWDVVAVLSSPTIMITQKHPFVNREIKKFIIIFFIKTSGQAENPKIFNFLAILYS